MTMMPFAAAALTSMSSTPMPARPITFEIGCGATTSRWPWWPSARRGRRSLDDLLQLLLGKPNLDVGGHAALLEDGNSGRRQLIGDETRGADMGCLRRHVPSQFPWERVRGGQGEEPAPSRAGAPIPPSPRPGMTRSALYAALARLARFSAKAQSSQGAKRLDIGLSRPSSRTRCEARRTIAVAGNVIGRLLLGQRRLQPLHERPSRVERQLGDGRIGDLGHTDVLERVAGSTARCSIHGVFSTQS